MSYPLWEVPLLGGGMLIAIVAVVHVFIAQFAVGGGLFLAMASRQAYRSGDRKWLEYLRHHSRFFLLAAASMNQCVQVSAVPCKDYKSPTAVRLCRVGGMSNAWPDHRPAVAPLTALGYDGD